MNYDYEVLVESVKRSPSPKLAYNMAKELLESEPILRSKLSRECLEVAWADAARFNRMVERLEGNLERPERKHANEDDIKQESLKVISSRKSISEFGRILSEYDSVSVQSIYQTVHQHLQMKVAK